MIWITLTAAILWGSPRKIEINRYTIYKLIVSQEGCNVVYGNGLIAEVTESCEQVKALMEMK